MPSPRQNIYHSGRLTEEQIVCVGAESPDAKYLQQIKELAMDVPHHSNRRLDVDDVALLHEQLLGLGTDGLDYWLGQKLLAVESLDAFIQVDSG